MHVVKAFLRPGWIVLGVVVVAFAAMCFYVLAPWQLGKNTATEHRNELIKTATSTDPVPIDEVAAPGATFDPNTEWREVTVTGRYLPDKQVLVRLRSVDERPAIEVLTPFAVDGGPRTVLVDRGYVRPDQNALPAIPAPPTGETTINARIRKSEGTTPGRGAHTEAGAMAVYTIDPAEVTRAEQVGLDPFYLQLSPGQPGALGEIPMPQLDAGPYLSYGLQWLAFGIMAPLGAGYFIYSEIKQRRRAKEQASADPSAPVTESAEPEKRRDRVRADLRDAGVSSSSRQRSAIGHAPEVDGTSEDVRAKLTRRYGG
ncbi:SURF1 family cytochrome oxidase biogenesis protein [Gordonia sp. CPCC 205515]|uniref:SURF1 family cytochrome oxidase biogenesis protein n=1 Tax=Gordonia sp. CPCC 205515 TaxID=3140791 RepID=UPI003AF37EC7